jgi:hypothetical protein
MMFDLYHTLYLFSQGNNTVIGTPVTWTVCFPQECRDGNFTSLKKGILTIINSRWDPIHIAEKSVITTCDEDFSYDAGAYCAIVLISVILFMVVIGSLWNPVEMMITNLKAVETRKVLVNVEQEDEDEIVPDHTPTILSEPVGAQKQTSAIGWQINYFLQVIFR